MSMILSMMFHLYCNMGMVEFDEMDYEDLENIKRLIGNHAEYTDSTVAKKILDNWGQNLGPICEGDAARLQKGD